MGGCSQLSNITTQLIASHLPTTLRRLDVGGLPNLIDIDLQDLRKCTQLGSLSVRACAKLTDAGVAHLAALCARQCKRAAADAEAAAGGAGGPPEAVMAAGAGAGGSGGFASEAVVMRSLDLGGLGRMSDKALASLLQSAAGLQRLDISGCSGLSPTGIVDAFGALPEPRRHAIERLTMTGLPQPVESKVDWERLAELLGPDAKLVH